jgi:endonuclease G
MSGYNSKFISETLEVKFPGFTEVQKADLAPCSDSSNYEYKYEHHSIFMSKSRKFPYFTATNINGGLMKPIHRDEVFDNGGENWRIDPRGSEFQHGQELYDADGSDFQRGHMTKREDPQWGTTTQIARAAAQSTFFFTNCVPQVAQLNLKEWKKLESYILNKVAKEDKLFISVFTGPVLSNLNPFFVTKVVGEDIKIPTHFWKVVYYTEDGITLKKVGFLMGQATLLKQKGIVNEGKIITQFKQFTTKEYFTDFEDSKTYQVSLATIEDLTQLKFPPASEPYTKSKSTKLILKDVEIGTETKGLIAESENFEFTNLIL